MSFPLFVALRGKLPAKTEEGQNESEMGIKGLSKLISTYAPRAIKEVDVKKYTGRMVAIDASVMIYQYLVASPTVEIML